MVRPEKIIDWKLVDRLLMADCHGTEIAAHFDMHPNTLYLRVQEEMGCGFSEYSQIKKAQGDSLLRDVQFKKATVDEDNTMLIYLGKVRLKQKEIDDTARPITNITINNSEHRPMDELQADPVDSGMQCVDQSMGGVSTSG